MSTMTVKVENWWVIHCDRRGWLASSPCTQWTPNVLNAARFFTESECVSHIADFLDSGTPVQIRGVLCES